MLPYPAVLFFFFRFSYQVLEVGAAVEQSAQTVFLCIIKVARILLENMPRPFPPQQAHISWLCNAPRWVPRPYTKHVFNCLFFFLIYIMTTSLCFYWKTPGKWLIPLHPCYISVSHLGFLVQIPNLSATLAGNPDTVQDHLCSSTPAILSY